MIPSGAKGPTKNVGQIVVRSAKEHQLGGLYGGEGGRGMVYGL